MIFSFLAGNLEKTFDLCDWGEILYKSCRETVEPILDQWSKIKLILQKLSTPTLVIPPTGKNNRSYLKRELNIKGECCDKKPEWDQRNKVVKLVGHIHDKAEQNNKEIHSHQNLGEVNKIFSYYYII